MIKIKVNGKEIEGRVFQNMPQALAFAFQNGNCHMAQTLEFASGEEKPKEPVKLVGTVSITGLLKEGEVLTADISGLEGLTGEETVNYQWGKAHIDSEVQQAIPEATGKEYTLTPEDAGMVINVGVEVSGFTGSVMSKDYGQVAAAEGTETTETIAGTSFEEMTTEELKFYIQKEEIPCGDIAGTEEEMRTQLIAAIKEAEEAGIILSDIPKEAEQEANLEANTKK